MADPLTILIDTGSGISIVNPKYVTNTFKSNTIKIQGIAGSQLIDIKSLVSFKLSKMEMKVEAYVIETNHNLLLGNDFLEKYMPDLDYKERVVKINEIYIPFALDSKEDPKFLDREIPILNAIKVSNNNEGKEKIWGIVDRNFFRIHSSSNHDTMEI